MIISLLCLIHCKGSTINKQIQKISGYAHAQVVAKKMPYSHKGKNVIELKAYFKFCKVFNDVKHDIDTFFTSMIIQ